MDKNKMNTYNCLMNKQAAGPLFKLFNRPVGVLGWSKKQRADKMSEAMRRYKIKEQAHDERVARRIKAIKEALPSKDALMQAGIVTGSVGATGLLGAGAFMTGRELGERYRVMQQAKAILDGRRLLQSTGIGAGVGGLAGAGLGYALSDENRRRNAFLAGLAGAGLGAGAGALLEHYGLVDKPRQIANGMYQKTIDGIQG